MDTPSLDQGMRKILAGFAEADAALDAMDDAVKAIIAAGQFGETAKREVRRLAEKTRGRQVRRAWADDRHTLAVLADEVTEAGEPITPQRLGQLAAEAKESP